MDKALPPSQLVNSFCLQSAFKSYTNSYKFLWFKAILRELHLSNFSHKVLDFDTLVKQMAVEAWYPKAHFKLSFGYWDKVGTCLDDLPPPSFTSIKARAIYNHFDGLFHHGKLSDISKALTRYVPYRFLTGWYESELRGIEDDNKRHRLTIKLASSTFDERIPLYRIENRSIVLHEKWVHYLKENFAIVEGWVNWLWVQYLEKNNAGVPAITRKILIDEEREAIPSVTKNVWAGLIDQVGLDCPYTGTPLSKSTFTLDHYVPWCYVAHNEGWNLVPVLKINPNVNSIKSNNLPAKKYLNGFIDSQVRYVDFSMRFLTQKKAFNLKAGYLEQLKISEDDFSDRNIFKGKLKEQIEYNIEGAKRLGFSKEWNYVQQP